MTRVELAGSPRVDVVYVTYWSLNDPLCQSQSLPYLLGLTTAGWSAALITFEQPRWRMAMDAAARARTSLRERGILWIPLRYHKKPPVLSTALDVALGAWRSRRIALRHGARLLHGRGTVAAAIACWASLGTGAAFFNDADGPLSQEYADAGLWEAGSLLHRGVARLEHLLVARADAVAALSALRRDELATRARVPVSVLPCGVDTRHFRRDPKGRRVRSELGLQGTVMVYTGKAGGWYRCDEMLDFAASAREELGPISLLIVTGDDPGRFLKPAAARGLPCVVQRAERQYVPTLLSAADVGLSFRAASPSQRACSPIKNAEYLACGLPVVSTPVAGDYPDLIRRCRVGVVVESPDSAGYSAAAKELRRLLAERGISERCRAAALAEVDLESVLIPRYRRIYEGLLGQPEELA